MAASAALMALVGKESVAIHVSAEVGATKDVLLIALLLAGAE
jgi:hypothetical protein